MIMTSEPLNRSTQGSGRHNGINRRKSTFPCTKPQSVEQHPDAPKIEFWFARDLPEPIGYARWENFFDHDSEGN